MRRTPAIAILVALFTQGCAMERTLQAPRIIGRVLPTIRQKAASGRASNSRLTKISQRLRKMPPLTNYSRPSLRLDDK